MHGKNGTGGGKTHGINILKDDNTIKLVVREKQESGVKVLTARALVELVVEVIGKGQRSGQESPAVRNICRYMQNAVFRKPEGGRIVVNPRCVLTLLKDSRMCADLVNVHKNFVRFLSSTPWNAVNNAMCNQCQTETGDSGLRKVVVEGRTKTGKSAQPDTYLYFVDKEEARAEVDAMAAAEKEKWLSSKRPKPQQTRRSPSKKSRQA